jgi:osmotically-inducible protein OsmY
MKRPRMWRSTPDTMVTVVEGAGEYRRDEDIASDVVSEIEWDPCAANGAEVSGGVAVVVQNGVVTLSGEVDSLARAAAVRRATCRVAGVLRVIDSMTVRPPEAWTGPDLSLAMAVSFGLAWDALAPSSIRATVIDGHVTLRGTVTWPYQRDAAEEAVRRLAGITGILSVITTTTPAPAPDLADQVRAAIARRLGPGADADSITVELNGGVVTLGGTVSSWPERQAAIAAAALGRGVVRVEDTLTVKSK